MSKLKQYNGSEWVEIAANGKSAYELWIAAGNRGTQQEFLRSLNGKDGKTPIKGTDYYTKAELAALKDDVAAEAYVRVVQKNVSSKTVSIAELDDVDLTTATKVNGKYVVGGGGATNFNDLGDVPASYTGNSGKVAAVKATEDGLEYIAVGGVGTVTGVSSATGAATVATGTTTPVITIVSAPKLTTARAINGVDFDGTAAITVADATKVVANAGITGATKTKVTYDAKGLVTAGADATTADIAASTNKNYVTDAQATVIGNTSGTNTGDNATNSQYSGLVTNATHTGDATGATALTVVKINGTSLAGLGTGLLKNTTGTGVPSIAVNSDLPAMTATVGGAVPTPPNNTTTFLRGDGTFAAPAGAGDMVLASVQSVTGLKTFDTTKLAVKGSSTGSTAVASANASATDYTATLPAKTGTVAMTSDITGTNSGTNTGDQTSIVGITGTMAQFDTAVSDGNIVYQSQALGTPLSGTVTNLTGTASININGTVGATTPTTIKATTIETTSTIDLGHATDTTLSRVSAGVVAVEGVNILTTAGGTLTGSITLGENTSIALDPAGSADGKYTGITVTGVAGYAQTYGDLVYLAVADSRWELADADATATAGQVALAMVVVAGGSDGAACTLLLQGIIRADAKFPTMTVGATQFVGETAGAIQGAIPTGADNVIRTVGYALTADELYFNPSTDWQITVA